MLQRMDNVLIVVEDLDAAKAFFAELGMELEGETTVEGPWVDQTVGLNGGDINVWVHAVHGTKPGPRLVILSGLHGDEWFSLESIKRIIDEADPATLSGSLLVVPFANSPALGASARNMPDETDSPDMNRIFPGPLKATSDQIIGVISFFATPSASATS